MGKERDDVQHAERPTVHDYKPRRVFVIPQASDHGKRRRINQRKSEYNRYSNELLLSKSFPIDEAAERAYRTYTECLPQSWLTGKEASKSGRILRCSLHQSAEAKK